MIDTNYGGLSGDLRCLARPAARATIARRSKSLASPQPTISANERKQPRQMSWSSRQQLRTQGDATADSGLNSAILFTWTYQFSDANIL
jgi:hypothetical protein